MDLLIELIDDWILVLCFYTLSYNPNPTLKGSSKWSIWLLTHFQHNTKLFAPQLAKICFIESKAITQIYRYSTIKRNYDKEKGKFAMNRYMLLMHIALCPFTIGRFPPDNPLKHDIEYLIISYPAYFIHQYVIIFCLFVTEPRVNYTSSGKTICFVI